MKYICRVLRNMQKIHNTIRYKMLFEQHRVNDKKKYPQDDDNTKVCVRTH